QLPRLHAYLRERSTWPVSNPAQKSQGPQTGEAERGQGRVAAAYASLNSRAREMAEAGDDGLFCLSWSSNQSPVALGVSRKCQTHLASNATAEKPETCTDMGANAEDRR